MILQAWPTSPSCFSRFEQAGLGADDLLFLGHRCLLEEPWLGLRNPDQFRPRHGSKSVFGNTVRQIKSKLPQKTVVAAERDQFDIARRRMQ